MMDIVQQYIFSQINERDLLYQYLQKYTHGHAEKICIFGAGNKGKEVFRECRKRLVDIYCFTDNNEKKYGYLVEGKYCIPLSYVKQEKEKILMIIAVQSQGAENEIKRQLEKEHFPYIITFKEVNEVFDNVPAVTWMEQVYEVTQVDISENCNRELISRMNQLIFDICMYYEKGKNE